MSRRITRRQLGLASLMGVGAASGVLIKLKYDDRLRLGTTLRDGTGTEVRIRPTPVLIEPYPDLAALVPAKRVAGLLSRLTPCWYPLKTGKVMHAWRLWGPDAVFPLHLYTYPFSSPVLSGKELTGYLLNDAVYTRYAPGASSLLSRTPHGIHIRIEPDRFTGTFTGGLGHSDDVLAGCGEVGLPSGTVVRTPYGDGALVDVVRNSVAEFRIDQELEWTVEAFARYLDDTDHWVNTAGEVTTFSDVAAKLLRRRYGEGPCLGTHTLNALVCLYRVDQKRPILTPEIRDAIPNYLKEAALLVTSARTGTGYWGGAWAPGSERPLTRQENERFAVASTGHHLEWMAIAPPELRPDRKTIGLAVSGILGVVEEMTPYDRSEEYLDLTHLGRALSLMLGRHPSVIVSEYGRA